MTRCSSYLLVASSLLVNCSCTTTSDRASAISTKMNPIVLKVDPIRGSFDPNSKSVKVVVRIRNMGRKTVTFLNHPDFIEIRTFKGSEEIPIANAGVHYKNQSTQDVEVVPSGQSVDITAWVQISGAKGNRAVDGVILTLLPVGQTNLPEDIKQRLRIDGASPLCERCQSPRITLRPAS